MNFLRTIKTKDAFGELDSLSKEERFFVSLFNNTDQVTVRDTTFILKDKQHYIFYDISEKRVWCDYDKIWSVLIFKFDLTDEDVKLIIKNVFKVAFGLKILRSNYHFSNNDVNK